MASRPERHGRTHKVARKLRYSDLGMPADLGAAVRGVGRRRTRRVLVGGARQVLVVALLPLWPFVAYPLSLAARGPRPRRPARMLHSVARHPVVIALGAPMRFVASHVPFRSAGAGREDRGPGGWSPPSAGDREPRRPKPGPPADAIALTEPRS